jgi:hypothetical protein
MTGLFYAARLKKEVNMKLIMAVLVVRAIISMIEKSGKSAPGKNDNPNIVIHPAEFQVR